MDKKTYTKFKVFFAWQDEEEEEWLEEMSLDGFHLKPPPFPMVYRFERGDPKRFVYRLDFKSSPKKDFETYVQLFADAGWEHVGSMGSWQYFRTQAKEGEQPEIFTDNASKVQKYQRLMLFLVIFFPLYFMMMVNLANSERDISNCVGLVMGAVIVLYTYAMVRIMLRIYQLKKP